MKNYFILTLFILSTSTTFAQQVTFGAKAGVNFTKFTNSSLPSTNESNEDATTNILTNNSYSFKNDMKFGALAGLYVNIALNNKFSLQTELMYAQFKNNENHSYLKEEIDNFDLSSPQLISTERTITQTNATFSLVSIPVLLQYNFYKGIYVAAGPQINYMLSAKDKSLIETYDADNNLISSNKPDMKEGKYKELDLAFNFGLGYVTNFGLNIDARYNIGGITNLNSSKELKPRSIQVTLGYDIF